MNIFLEEHQQVLEKLVDKGVEFLIIGGYAVNFHGYNRVTGDLDIWIKPDNINKDRLVGMLSEMQFDSSGLDSLKKADFTAPFVFYIWEEPYKVDFLTHISGNSFREAYARRVVKDIEGIQLPFISITDLVASKIATTRLRDKADVEELQKVARFLNPGSQ
ncbi:MAG: hypothetical protein D4R67_11280 [Bacteroidetes bacterium]|nr:MAG: hypothetical protein D4R67_11280 [Bacteroidota bacterium]